jgi:hypothetical protein
MVHFNFAGQNQFKPKIPLRTSTVDKFCPTGYNISTGTSGQEALKTFGLYSLLIINSNNKLDWVLFTVSYYSLDVILFYVMVSPPAAP